MSKVLNTPPTKAVVFMAAWILSATSGVFAQTVPQTSSSAVQTTATTAGPGGQATGENEKLAIKLLRKNLRVSGLNQKMVDSYVVTDAYMDKKAGQFLVYLQQTHLGIPVYNKIGVFVFKNEVLVHSTPNFLPRVDTKLAGVKASAGIDGAQAIRFAAGHVSIPMSRQPQLLNKDNIRQRFVYSGLSAGRKSTTSDLVWLPANDDKTLKLAWNVRVTSDDGRQDWYVHVDAQTGEILGKHSLVLSEAAGRLATDDCVDGAGGMSAGGAIGTATALGTAGAAETVIAEKTAGAMGTAFTAGTTGTAGKTMSAIGQATMPLAPPPPAVSSAGYRVFAFPSQGAGFESRTVESNPWLKAGSTNNAVSLGWHYDNTNSYEYTRGNNVWTQQDFAGNDGTAGWSDTSTTGSPTLTFDRNYDPTASIISYNNVRAGMDNLFYWNNIMHDISYQYGFDEPSGNFQADNQGRGGVGGDYVHAFAQDGSGINNSNFSTPPDGESGIMRMFQWSTAISTTAVINAPSAVTGTDAAVESALSFKNRLVDTGPITADVVLVNDPSGTTHQACSSITNASSLPGKIAMIDRGGSSCPFTLKIKNAQNAGAVGVIMVNNVSTAPTIMAGLDTTITIPAVMISQANGTTLKSNLTGLNATLSSTGQYIDGNMDNGVISHEFTHGISNRLTGGPANVGCLFSAEQAGEGWSDYVALMVTTDWSTATIADGSLKRTIGTYVLNEPSTGAGIRTYPYSTDMSVNPWTYAMMAGSTSGEAHTIGEIWCATIWDMTWNIIQQEGIDPDIYHGTKGNNIALQLVLQGMKLQPCSPGFIDSRNAILKADSLLYGYKHKCAIWEAFRRRGMGVNASQGSSNSYTDQTADFTSPSSLGISLSVDKTNPAPGDNLIYTLKAYCDCSPLSNISIVDTLSSNQSYTSSTGGTYTSPYVHFDNLSFTAGEAKTFTIQTQVTGTYHVPDTLIKDTRDPANYTWTASTAASSYFFTDVTTRAHSGTHSYYAPDISTQSDMRLTTADLVLDTVSTFSFWHYYETDAGYDGGLVEISTDGGSTWSDLGNYMTQNGYNSSLAADNVYVPSRFAFTGSSGGAFIQTVIKLTGFAGKTAKIRFRFSSDASVGGDGWYIDDMVLTNANGAVSVANAYSGSTLLSTSLMASAFGPGALAVNFLGFDARKVTQTTALHWIVNGEIDVDKYIVQRSTDGIHYSAIGEVGATTVNGSGNKDYYYTDASPAAGKNYYRIAEQDLDGKQTISPVRLVDFGGGALAIRLAPVPTYDHSVLLDIDGGDDVTIQASLLTTTGQMVKQFSVRRGTNRLTLDGLSKGMYFLRIQAGKDNTEIRKVVIQ